MGALSFFARRMFWATRSRARSALEPACSRARCVSITSLTSGGRNADVRRISSSIWRWKALLFMTRLGFRGQATGIQRFARRARTAESEARRLLPVRDVHLDGLEDL